MVPISVARRQHAIESARRASALDMAKHDVASLKPGATFEFARQNLPMPPRRT